MNNLITKLDNTLKQKNPYLFSLMNNGLESEIVEEKLAYVGLQKHQFLVSLYEAHNGTSNIEEEPIDNVLLMPLGVFYPLEDAIEQYEYFCLQYKYWDSQLFPFLFSGAGDFYLLNLGNQSFEDNAVYFYSPALLVNEPELYFNSLEKMVEGIIECYESGIYSISDMGEFINTGHKKIFKRLNSKSLRWK